MLNQESFWHQPILFGLGLITHLVTEVPDLCLTDLDKVSFQDLLMCGIKVTKQFFGKLETP